MGNDTGNDKQGGERTDSRRVLTHWGHSAAADTPRPRTPGEWARAAVRAVRTRRVLAAALVVALAIVANFAYDWFGPIRFHAPPASSASSAPMPDSWPMAQRGPGRNAYVDAASLDAPPSVAWRYELGARLWAAPVVADGALFAAGESGRAVSLDAGRGEPRWESDLGAAVRSSPAVAGGAVVFSALDGGLAALDTTTGERLWRYEMGDQSLSSPAVFQGTVYVGSNDWHLYAVDVETGELRWRYKARDSVRSGPAVTPDSVVFSDVTNRLYTLDRDRGAFRFDFKTAGPTRGGAAIQGERAYVADRGGRVRSVAYLARDLPFEKAFLRIRAQLFAWNMIRVAPVPKGSAWYFRKRGEEFGSTPVAAHGAVYAATQSGAVYALAQDDGSPLWEARTDDAVSGSPLVVGDAVIVGDAGGTLYAFHAESGVELWRVALDGELVATPVYAGGALFVVSSSGTVYALR